jgi:hypothetical protein
MNAIQVKVDSDQEETKFAINSIQTELEETMKPLVDDVLAYVGQRTQALRKELIEIDETQVDLQAVKTSLDTWTKSFQENQGDTKNSPSCSTSRHGQRRT